MAHTPIDVIFSDTLLSDDKNFEFYFQNQKIGKCSVSLFKNAWGLCEEQQFFPDSWFDQSQKEQTAYGVRAPLKPFLEITNFDFSNFQGQGFGRMGLQKMYQLSQELGAEGRMSLIAQKKKTSLRSPAPFYEFCGFKGIISGQEERKYFNPTPNNLKTLFSKPIHPLFKMKEIPITPNENSFIDNKTGQIKVSQALKTLLNQKISRSSNN